MATRGGSVPVSANEEMPPQARATVATAERAGGASVGEAIGAIKNAGGGQLKVKANDATGMGVLKTMLPSNFLQDEKGNVALFNPENQFKIFNTEGKEIKVGNTITVMVTENGIAIKNVDSMGRFMPPKTKAEISPDLALAINEQFVNSKVPMSSKFVPEGTLPSLTGSASNYFTVAGSADQKPDKASVALRKKARELGIEGIAND